MPHDSRYAQDTDKRNVFYLAERGEEEKYDQAEVTCHHLLLPETKTRQRI